MLSMPTLHDVLNILPAVVYRYVLHSDDTSELLYISPSSADILGHPPEYFTQDLDKFWAMVHPDDLERLRQEDAEANRKNALFVSEVRVLLPSGQERWIQLSSKPTSETKNGSVIWIGYIVDITRLKHIEEKLLDANRKLTALSVTDGLTGLANRRHFDEKLGEEWARCKRTGKPFSLILVDVDFFKSYNDQYGHQRGDECLKSIASILKSWARRAGDLSARYGGEEFIIIAFNTALPEAAHMAEQICQAVDALDIENKNTPLGKITVSVGVSSIEYDEYATPRDLFNAADTALYRAKRAQRNCVRIADPGLRSREVPSGPKTQG